MTILGAREISCLHERKVCLVASEKGLMGIHGMIHAKTGIKLFFDCFKNKNYWM